MANLPNPPLVESLSALDADYRALLCDVWGVVHNGVSAFPEAIAALRAFRARRGKVLLISNAPRPHSSVVPQLDRLGVTRDAYDDILTSGDVARSELARRDAAKVLHVGPDRDLPLYEGLSVQLVGEDECDIISCTGLVDDTSETPDDYEPSLERWRARGLPMLCANPDLVVERGNQLVWCAGAIAERYRAAGGTTTVVGKPYPEIYAMALAMLGEVSSVLALGDGLETDVRGAFNAGIDVTFVSGGIHAGDFGDRERPDLAGVHARLSRAGLGARAVMTRLT
jgi:HAD superfamily hydrolase (TIGR01459 family)